MYSNCRSHQQWVQVPIMKPHLHHIYAALNFGFPYRIGAWCRWLQVFVRIAALCLQSGSNPSGLCREAFPRAPLVRWSRNCGPLGFCSCSCSGNAARQRYCKDFAYHAELRQHCTVCLAGGAQSASLSFHNGNLSLTFV